MEYATVAQRMSPFAQRMTERLSPFQGEGDYTFAPHMAPLPWGNNPGERKTYDIKACAGFEHCVQGCETWGFFFKNARDVPKEKIFRDWDEIVNEVEMHLATAAVPVVARPRL